MKITKQDTAPPPPKLPILIEAPADVEIEITVPRDRNEDFDPIIVKKYEKTIGSIEDKIISMYAKAMTIRDIQSHIIELCILTELKNRGVEDIFIASIDGLKGFPEAINTVFSKTEIQLCVIYQIRNTLKYAASKDKKCL
ncbi:MAG: hypothetical protein CR986_01330 [Ignavibacteriae bacterium]|nr:MAG: hypothetical protein CR986_01330 [Ignavibacteriota bacterium]